MAPYVALGWPGLPPVAVVCTYPSIGRRGLLEVHMAARNHLCRMQTVSAALGTARSTRPTEENEEAAQPAPETVGPQHTGLKAQVAVYPYPFWAGLLFFPSNPSSNPKKAPLLINLAGSAVNRRITREWRRKNSHLAACSAALSSSQRFAHVLTMQ
uniref:Uncharacterized protein n=1 Tax=Setaria viridis TaxID=4556 RepID=A0A4U6TSM1_SETVI|nr:hypothetical protein SEVIR_7G109300v2 [Setaria viridis]